MPDHDLTCALCGLVPGHCLCERAHGEAVNVPIRPAPVLLPFEPPASQSGLVARLAADLRGERTGRLAAVARADQLQAAVLRLAAELGETRQQLGRVNEINADLQAENAELRLRAG